MAPHLIQNPGRLPRRTFGIIAAAIVMATLPGCGSADDTPSGITNPATPSVDLAVAPGNLMLFQGERASVTVTIYRQGNYTEPVELTLGSLPAGIMAELSTTVCPLGTSRTSLNVWTSANAPVGTIPVIIGVSGPGVPTETAFFLLTIQRDTLPPSVSMQFASDDGLIYTVQGDTWEWDLILTRHGGYRGDVEIVFEGLPAGVTVQLGSAVEVDLRKTRIPVGFSALADAPPSDTQAVVRAFGPGIPEASLVFRLGVAPPWH